MKVLVGLLLFVGAVYVTWPPDVSDWSLAIVLFVLWLVFVGSLSEAWRLSKIAIPEDLEKRGLGEGRMRSMVTADLRDILRRLRRSGISVAFQMVPPPDIEVPGTKLSLSFVRDLIAYFSQRSQPTISGQIIPVDETAYRIVFSSSRDGHEVEAGRLNPNDLQRQNSLAGLSLASAFTVLRLASPFHAAIFAMELDQFPLARTIAGDAIKGRTASAGTKGACWSVVAFSLLIDGRREDAARALKKAEALNPDFPLTVRSIAALLKENFERHGYRPGSPDKSDEPARILRWYQDVSEATGSDAMNGLFRKLDMRLRFRGIERRFLKYIGDFNTRLDDA